MFRYIATEELSLRAPLFACYAGFYVRAFRGNRDLENTRVNEKAANYNFYSDWQDLAHSQSPRDDCGRIGFSPLRS